ncbi:Hypothetical_protein [Hexamita inflata]|uniref:Hypothetical_protein n=1 Tax=Hexamita inflata TaxID=28002 RepID=A0ABP1HSJ9_9EUKA
MLVISLQHQFYLLTTIYKASFTCAQLQKCHKAGVSARMNSIWQTRLKQLVQKLLLEVSADQVQQIVLSLDNLQQLVISHGIVKCVVVLLLNSTYYSFYSLYPFIRLLFQYQFLIQYGIKPAAWILENKLKFAQKCILRTIVQSISQAKCKCSQNLQCLNFLEAAASLLIFFAEYWYTIILQQII